ncbi:MAG: hypothetical protein F4039_00730 [Gammaproteobacteria bacterium]|nr:hypothetical protein [Gammaproteobacteria bacterium]MYF52257.1 hypothetical protein [Gammaproteobacteria bacterium]MYK42605.1 hypothetical protein [Gammaproteobacteria bacterium]
MNMKHCEWDENNLFWKVYHDGRMSRVKSSTVLEAAVESGFGNYIVKRSGDKERLHLGNLYHASKATWKNSKNFLANLLHLGIVRTHLRDALQEHRSK